MDPRDQGNSKWGSCLDCLARRRSDTNTRCETKRVLLITGFPVLSDFGQAADPDDDIDIWAKLGRVRWVSAARNPLYRGSFHQCRQAVSIYWWCTYEASHLNKSAISHDPAHGPHTSASYRAEPGGAEKSNQSLEYKHIYISHFSVWRSLSI